MKKTGLILSIIGVVAVVVIATTAIVFGGTDMAGYNYVKLSVNPQIEFVCDGETVVALNAINEEAKELCAQESFINTNIEEACTKFVDLCCRAGYLNVDANDNAVKIDCVSGLSQSLQVKVYNVIEDYLKNNQILGAVIEASNDNAANKQAKEAGVSVDKFALIQSFLNLDDSKTFSECKGMTESELIKKLEDLMKKNGNPTENYTEEQLTNKRVLIDINRVKFAEHVEAITEESKSAFKQLFNKNQKEIKKEVANNFNSAYDIWKNNHINFVS